MAEPLRDWYLSAVTVAIAAKLLAAQPDQPLRTDELARELQRPERSVRDLLDRLNTGRLVTRTQLQTGEPGRPPWGYWLADEQRPAAQRAVDTPEVLRESRHKRDSARVTDDTAVTASPSDVRVTSPLEPDVDEAQTRAPEAEAPTAPGTGATRGQEVVIVDVSGAAYAQLLEALTETRTADDASLVIWVGDEVVFLFGGANAPSAAADLLVALAGARLSVRSATVREVMPGAELIARAGRMAPEIRRARSTRDAHDAPQ
jgi:predicted transcriptional regulator